MIELLCTDYNKKATSIHYYFGNAVLAIFHEKSVVRAIAKQVPITDSSFAIAAVISVVPTLEYAFPK